MAAQTKGTASTATVRIRNASGSLLLRTFVLGVLVSRSRIAPRRQSLNRRGSAMDLFKNDLTIAVLMMVIGALMLLAIPFIGKRYY